MSGERSSFRMNKMRGLWMGVFIFFLMVGPISCSGTKPQLKAEPSETVPQEGSPELLSKIPMPPSQQKSDVSSSMAEVPKTEKLEVPPVQNQKSQITIPASPAPTPPQPRPQPQPSIPPFPPSASPSVVRPPEPPKIRGSSSISTMQIFMK